MRAELRAGVAIYNAGEYHAAHDAWEDRWLGLESGSDDERLLHGLIQFTAAIHHARRRNWEGAVGLAESARDYLSGLPADYRGVDLGPVRSALESLSNDPEWIERRRPPRLIHEGETLALDDLEFEPAAVAARVFGEEDERFEGSVVERAIAYAEDEIESGDETGRFVALVLAFARGDEREIAYRRLADQVDRRRSRDRDVDGLFEP